ncbi:MAG: hypothetical protein WC716_12455 [Chitinophagaceae bacterium]|jgi:hypothetical protein
MRILKFLYRKDSLKRKVIEIELELIKTVKFYINDNIWIYRYGAYDISPKNLVYWICVKTDKDKLYLQSNETLMQDLRSILVKYNYPEEAIPFVHIGIESQETVDRVSRGNWYHHFK